MKFQSKVQPEGGSGWARPNIHGSHYLHCHQLCSDTAAPQMFKICFFMPKASKTRVHICFWTQKPSTREPELFRSHSPYRFWLMPPGVFALSQANSCPRRAWSLKYSIDAWVTLSEIENYLLEYLWVAACGTIEIRLDAQGGLHSPDELCLLIWLLLRCDPLRHQVLLQAVDSSSKWEELSPW